MASSVLRLGKLGYALSRRSLSTTAVKCVGTTAVKCGGHWNHHWKPGPYPTTDEERAAAAKKYGLLPEDYKPMPDDGFGEGDYPDLPETPLDARDPYEDYDMPGYKRNYGEPLYANQDVQNEAWWNPHMVWPYSYKVMVGAFVAVYGGWLGLNYLSRNFTYVKPVFKQQYPKDGPHYTFERNDCVA